MATGHKLIFSQGEVIMRLDMMLAYRKMRLNKLAALTGMPITNLSFIKTGKARSITFETLLRICAVLDCKPNDLFELRPVKEVNEPTAL